MHQYGAKQSAQKELLKANPQRLPMYLRLDKDGPEMGGQTTSWPTSDWSTNKCKKQHPKHPESNRDAQTHPLHCEILETCISAQRTCTVSTGAKNAHYVADRSLWPLSSHRTDPQPFNHTYWRLTFVACVPLNLATSSRVMSRNSVPHSSLGSMSVENSAFLFSLGWLSQPTH